MLVGRRGLVLSLNFLTLVLFITSGHPVRAQQPGSHRLWGNDLTPEQLKAALAKLSGDGEDNPFQEQIERLLKEKRHNPDDIQKALKLLREKPELMELAKRMAKQRQMDPGRPGKLTQADLSKLVQIGPQGVQPGTEVIPPPGSITPVPGGVGLGAGIGDATPPTPPNQDMPPNMGMPPNPPPTPGTIPPQLQNPINTASPNLLRPPSVDDNPFPDPGIDSRTKSLQAFAALWERNIGPLDETPEVKRALFDLVGSNGLDFDIKDSQGNSIWDLLNKGGGEGTGFGEFLKGAETGDWKLPQIRFPKLGNWGNWFGTGSGIGGGGSGGGPTMPRPGGAGSGDGFGGLNFGGSWTPVILIGLILFGVLLWFWLKNVRFSSDDRVVLESGCLGPWPVDPRAINTREDVVKAFEYLSVLICGPSARTWTHGTIAGALADLATTHGERAVLLARLYELARYAPLDEPLTQDELIEARQLVCALAGVSC